MVVVVVRGELESVMGLIMLFAQEEESRATLKTGDARDVCETRSAVGSSSF